MCQTDNGWRTIKKEKNERENGSVQLSECEVIARIIDDDGTSLTAREPVATRCHHAVSGRPGT